MLLTTTSDVPTKVEGFYSRAKLRRANPLLLHDRFAERHPLPRNEGDRITMHRWGTLPVASQLKEGIPPAGKKAQVSALYTELVQFGDFLTFTDRVKLTSPDPVLTRFAEILGEQEGLTIDSFHRDQQLSGTGVRYANGVSNRSSVAAVPSATDLKQIVRMLEANNTAKVREMIKATTKVSTMPIRASMIGLTHTNCKQDYENITGFTPVEQYASYKDRLEGEFGEYKGIRWCATTNAKIQEGSGSATTTGLLNDGSNVDVYQSIVMGKYAYGTVPLQEGGSQNIVKDLGKTGWNPLNQFGTSGWKAFVAGMITNDNFIIRFEHACSDLS